MKTAYVVGVLAAVAGAVVIGVALASNSSPSKPSPKPSPRPSPSPRGDPYVPRDGTCPEGYKMIDGICYPDYTPTS